MDEQLMVIHSQFVDILNSQSRFQRKKQMKISVCRLALLTKSFRTNDDTLVRGSKILWVVGYSGLRSATSSLKRTLSPLVTSIDHNVFFFPLQKPPTI